jgi:hypothetical protein
MKTLLTLAEIGLVITLFMAAAHVNRNILKRNKYMPVRLLTTGLLLILILVILATRVIYS